MISIAYSIEIFVFKGFVIVGLLRLKVLAAFTSFRQPKVIKRA